MPPSGRRFLVSNLDTVPIFQLAIQAKLISMSWLLRVMRPFGSTVTPSPLEPKPPSTTGGQTMTLQMSTMLLFPPPSPPSGLPPPPSPPPGVVTTGKRETSPLHVQPETAVIAAATIRKGNALWVIEAVSTSGGTALCALRAHDGPSGEE